MRSRALRTIPLIAIMIAGPPACWLPGHGLGAQVPGPPEARPTVDTFEMRRSAANAIPTLRRPGGGRVELRGFTLWDFIRLVYGPETYRTPGQVVGGPPWLDTERFDVDLTEVDDAVPTDPASLRLSPVLVERLRAMLGHGFDLQVRTARQEQDLFALLRLDATALGPAVTPRDGCQPQDADVVAHPRERCDHSTVGPGILLGWGLSMDRLAGVLSFFPEVGRVVLNETGLAGSFDLRMSWTPAVVGNMLGGQARPNPNAGSGPDLFLALERQIGLGLEPRRGPVDVIIVERVRLPEIEP